MLLTDSRRHRRRRLFIKQKKCSHNVQKGKCLGRSNR